MQHPCELRHSGRRAFNSLSSAVLVGGSWVAESVPDPGSDVFLYDVSCASPTFCMAVGSIQVAGAGWATGLTEAWDGASWVVVPSPNYPEDDLGPGFIGGGILISDSCVSAQACVAVGYGGGGLNSSSLSYPILAVVETWDGDAWSLTPTPAPVEPVGGGRANLRGVSCVPDANDAQCVAVGLQTPDNATISPLVETTSAAVGSLDATSTQVQSDGEGDLSATVAAGASPAFGALDTAAGTATPTGSVTFLNDGVPILACPPSELDSGQASCSAGSGATGPITADYSGDATFDGSSSQQVGTLPVTYAGNGATSGTVPVDSASPYDSSATVTVLPPGTLGRAGYNFSGWNTKADGSGSSHAPGATFTILASTELFAVWTAGLSLTPTIVPSNPSTSVSTVSRQLLGHCDRGGAPPTGTVTFSVGDTTLCSHALASGSASCSSAPRRWATIPSPSPMAAIELLLELDHLVDRRFPGVVGDVGDPSVNPVQCTTNVTYSATVSVDSPGTGIPSGTVAFTSDGTTIGTCSAVALSSGLAQCTTEYLAGGP